MATGSSSKPFRLPWHKRLLGHPAFQSAVCALMAWLLKACWHTYRVNRTVPAAAADYMNGQRNGIFCFWHGRMIVFPRLKPHGRAMHVLISHHRDGELIARVIRHFGIGSVRGSSNRGAMEATRELARCLKAGDNVAITPDGPRGPACVAQEGAAMLARLSGLPLIPVSFSASSARQLASWDRFLIPLPFSRIDIQVGEPITITRTDDLHQGSRLLSDQMNQLTQQADAATGRSMG